jgi:hypothetical protein
MSVRRYRPTVTDVQATAYCGDHPDGEYVRVDDYNILAAEISNWRRTALQQQETLRLQAAENAALKKDVERLMCHVRKSPALSNEYVQLAEAEIAKLRAAIDAALTKETEK